MLFPQLNVFTDLHKAHYYCIVLFDLFIKILATNRKYCKYWKRLLLAQEFWNSTGICRLFKPDIYGRCILLEEATNERELNESAVFSGCERP